MRLLQGNRKSSCRTILILALVFSTLPFLRAQQSETADSVDARAYAALFRRVLLFEGMAAQADKAGTPKPHLRRNLQTRFQLSNDDNASLLRYAQAWDSDRAPILAREAQMQKQFRDTYASGIVPPRQTLSLAPEELANLSSQVDTLTLHYRDLLRNAMRTTDYDHLEGELQKSFGVAVSPAALTGNQRDGGAK